MKSLKEKKWRGWWRSSLLLTLLLPLLGTHADMVNLTRGRMVQLAKTIERVYEQTGSYPQRLDAGILADFMEGGSVCACRDAWGRRLVYSFRNPGSRISGEYWLGSSCGKPFFGGFLRFMIGRHTPEGDDLVLHNGEFVQVPSDVKASDEALG